VQTFPNAVETRAFINAFKAAWEISVTEYEFRRINGEHTLQASLYRHMSDRLDAKKGYRIFTEASVLRGDLKSEDKNKLVRSEIDILVVHQSSDNTPSVVVGAVELKFKSRGAPTENEVRTDLTRLSSIANRRKKDLRSKLYMHRMLSEDKKPEEFLILPQKRLIFAAFCNSDHSAIEKRINPNHFWSAHKPKKGRWENQRHWPPHLGVALAKTKPVPEGRKNCEGLTVKEYFGGAFKID
jgi:hypothetical protein